MKMTYPTNKNSIVQTEFSNENFEKENSDCDKIADL